MKKLIYFGAEHCPQCKVFLPKFRELCDRLGFSNYQTVDVEDQEELAEKYNVKNIPLVIFLDDMENEVQRRPAGKAMNEIVEFINR